MALDDEMKQMVRGIEKKYGFTPNFVRLFASDNKRLRAFMVPYMELMRPDSGLSALDHELIALACAVANGCAYCCAHALLEIQPADVAQRTARPRVVDCRCHCRILLVSNLHPRPS